MLLQHKGARAEKLAKKQNMLHAPSSGLFFATDLAISVRLVSASVGLASVYRPFSVALALRLGGEVETQRCIWFSRPNIWLKEAQGLAHQKTC